MDAGGTWKISDQISQHDSWQVENPSKVRVVGFGDTGYVIVASTGTHSLSVFELTNSGELNATDHIYDTLSTRFQNTIDFDVVKFHGRVLVVVAGADSGLTLMELLPTGQLIILDVFIDTVATPLDGLEKVIFQQVDDALWILTLAQRDEGLGRILVDINATDKRLIANHVGEDLSGSDGDDIIVDGEGQDRLFGGFGADHFVLNLDGQADVILDFDPQKDILDLSFWIGVYSADQIGVSDFGDHIQLNYDEEILVISWENASFQFSGRLDDLNILYSNRMNITEADLQTSTPSETQSPIKSGTDLTPDEDATFHAYDPIEDEETSSGIVPTCVQITVKEAFGEDRAHVADLQDWTHSLRITLDQDAVGFDIEGTSDWNALIATRYDDEITATEQGDTIHGAAGDDLISGLAGDDWLLGGDGNDALRGQEGDDSLYGGAGSDKMPAGAGNDYLDGGAGDDAMGGGTGQDTLYGGDGNDTLGSGNDDDLANGGAGNDVIAAASGNDTLVGGKGDDRLAGSYGNDSIRGGDGIDSIGGGRGYDMILAGSGDDEIGAGEHDDTIYAGEGDDFLSAGDGDDELYGQDGNDRLTGAKGSDTLVGGDGNDAFLFWARADSDVDRVLDFEDGVDWIEISRLPGKTAAQKYQSLEIRQQDDDVWITFDGMSVVLESVDVKLISIADFVF